jgi:hypothetical protein
MKFAGAIERGLDADCSECERCSDGVEARGGDGDADHAEDARVWMSSKYPSSAVGIRLTFNIGRRDVLANLRDVLLIDERPQRQPRRERQIACGAEEAPILVVEATRIVAANK